MNGAEERPLVAQLTTARLLLAQFGEQLAEYQHMPPRKRRTTARGKDLTARLSGLRAGHATWTERVADLEARIAAEPA